MQLVKQLVTRGKYINMSTLLYQLIFFGSANFFQHILEYIIFVFETQSAVILTYFVSLCLILTMIFYNERFTHFIWTHNFWNIYQHWLVTFCIFPSDDCATTRYKFHNLILLCYIYALSKAPIYIYIYIYMCVCVCVCVCVSLSVCEYGAFNKFPDFFIQAFKIVVDSWKFTMLLLYTL